MVPEAAPIRFDREIFSMLRERAAMKLSPSAQTIIKRPMETFTRWFVLHGSIALWTGLVGGYFHAGAIKAGRNEVPWRIVHSGGCMAGIMLLALAWPLRFLDLPDWGMTLFAWTLIGGNYLLLLGMVIAACSDERGLASGGSPTNRIVRLLYGVGGVASLTGETVLVIGVARGFFP